MSQAGIQTAGYRFDDFYIDAGNRQLWRDGKLLSLNSKYFDVLLLLVSRSGQLVEKQRIFDEVWSGVFVTDAALTQCIKDIRKQLGDDASRPRYIKTVPKHGYVFIGTATESVAAPAVPEARPSTLEELRQEPPANQAAFPARPYKFLDYFTEQDAQLFFGREPEVEAICSQILAHRSFVLHGRSGVGKSSILRAGLMPRLRAEGHRVFVIRSFTDPIHQMIGALTAAVDGAAGYQLSLEYIIRRAAKESPNHFIIFFLDQFEEFFSLLGEQARQDFIAAIGDLVALEGLPVRLVFALREDLLAEMSQLKPAIPEIFHHEYRLKRLSRPQAARAITEPANRVGCRFEPTLVERLLEDLSDGERIDPPQLQIVCDNLYDSRDPTGALTLAIYNQLGTASQILAGYLERVLRRFDATDFQVAKEILISLITVDGQRLVLRAPDLLTRLAGRAPEGSRVGDVIEELVAARVVRRRRQDGEGWLELAHDFLTPEVRRWLGADEIALKRARGIFERAMENYRTHRLIIDADALGLLVPFGEQLALTGEEADLLITSLLNRGCQVPEWLVRAAPQAATLIAEASANREPEVRLNVIEAALLLGGEQMKSLLRKMALWDQDLGVRKAASVALARWFKTRAERILSDASAGEAVGVVRRSISLAMIRDFDKRLVELTRLSIPAALLIVLALVWVRLRRGGHAIVWQGIGGTVGGGASGLIGGLMLSTGLAMAKHATMVEAVSLIIVLVSLGVFIGSIAGFSVSLGMAAASHVAYRHSRWWSVIGGAAGGAIVGGSSKLLGVDTLRALFGQSPTQITGAFEGAMIGAGVSLGPVLIQQLMARARPWQKVVGASAGAVAAGVLLTVIGGNLFSASLEIVARSFADSQIRMDPLAPFFGEVRFGQTTQIILGAIEGLLFGAGMTAGVEMSNRARQEDSRTR